MVKTRKLKKLLKKLLLVFLIITISGVLSIAVDTSIAYAQPAGGAGYFADFISAFGNFIGSAGVAVGKTAALAPLGAAGAILQTIGLFLLLLAGNMLDIAIPFSINSANLLSAPIQLGWTIFRDLVNMAFIFILLYIAVMTILQASNFQTKKLLAAVIIVALLVNFSFFLTGLVIDASNILALFIYSAMTECPTGIKCSALGGIRPLSEVFMEGLELAGLSSRISFQFGSIIDSSFEIMLNFFMQGVLYIVAASALLAGAMIFILRTVSLMFILILSPVAFVSLVLPATRKLWSEWLHKLIGHAFVAPVYLLLIAVVIAIIDSDVIVNSVNNMRTTSGVPTAAVNAAAGLNVSQPSVDQFGILLTYALIIGLIHGSLIISKRMAGDIANLAVKWSGRLTGSVLGGVVGGVAAGGLALNAMALRAGFRGINQATKKYTKETTRAGKVMRTFSSKLATLSADPRTTRLGKATVKELKSATGVDVGSVAGDFGKARTEEERKKVRAKKLADKGKEEAERLKKESPDLSERKAIEEQHKKLSEVKDKESIAKSTVISARIHGVDAEIQKAEAAAKTAKRDVDTVSNTIKAMQSTITRRGERRVEKRATDLARPDRGFFAKVTGRAERDRQLAAEMRRVKSTGEKILETIQQDPGWGGTKPEEESQT